MPDRLLLHPIVSFRHLVGHFKLKYHLRKMRKGLKKMTGEEYSDAGLILGIEKWLGGVDSETKGE